MFEPMFPQELLTKSHTERLDYFKKHTVTHTLFEHIFQEVLFAIQDAQPGTLIFVYGPSGVGKTTLLRLIENVLTKQILGELKNDLQRIPIVSLNAVETESNSFDWKDFFQRFLIKLNDPFPENKLDLVLPDDIYKQNKQLLESGDKGTARKYRRTVEGLLQILNPLMVSIDDAQHIAKVVSSRKLLNQINVVKSVADQSNTVYVLSGTYELIPFLNLNDQVSRRSIYIQFPRYKASIKEDCERFISTLNTFQLHLPLEKTPDLISRWDYFYERTIGCIGTLNDWLERSLSLALRDGGREMKPVHWEKRSPLLSQCRRKFSEVSRAESLLEEKADDWLNYRNDLGLNGSESEYLYFPKQPPEEKNKDVVEPGKKKRKEKVGVRNPRRDSIGPN